MSSEKLPSAVDESKYGNPIRHYIENERPCNTALNTLLLRGQGTQQQKRQKVFKSQWNGGQKENKTRPSKSTGSMDCTRWGPRARGVGTRPVPNPEAVSS